MDTNLYAHAGDNPITHIDPAGEQHIDLGGDLSTRAGKMTFYENLKRYVAQNLERGGADPGYVKRLTDALSHAKKYLSKAEFRYVRNIARPGFTLRTSFFDPVKIIRDLIAVGKYACGDEDALYGRGLEAAAERQGNPEYIITSFGPVLNPNYHPGMM